jgi:hypothetical protein
MTVNTVFKIFLGMNQMNFPRQAEELRALLDESHLTLDKIADLSFVKTETLRKYLGGYQKCGMRTLQQIRRAVRGEVDRMRRAAEVGLPGATEKHDKAIAVAGRFLELPPGKQELAEDLIDSLLQGSGGGRPKRPSSLKTSPNTGDIFASESRALTKGSPDTKRKVSKRGGRASGRAPGVASRTTYSPKPSSEDPRNRPGES